MTEPRRIVIVEWIDAHTTGHEELAPEEIETSLHFGYHTTSYGLLVRSDHAGVSLCSDLQAGPDGAQHYRCAHFIPRGMVLSERTIPAPRAARPAKAAKSGEVRKTRQKAKDSKASEPKTPDPSASVA